MIHLEIGGEKYPIAAGETVIGSASDSAVVLRGEGVRPRHAVVQGAPAGAAIRSAEGGAEVKVNGVRLGTDPTPLLHGDKIEIAGHELLVVDPTRAGSTQLFDSGAFADLAPPPKAKGAGVATGGRLVCLTDGREYTVGTEPLSFGRDAGSDVVVTGTEVSRHHAEIRSDPNGFYILHDLSVNGTLVNGHRIGKTHQLARADVIRIGHDEFRFYGEAASFSPKSTPIPDPPNPPAPPTGAAQRLSDTMHGLSGSEAQQRITPTSPEPAPLASLLFRSGDLRGRRVPVTVPVINIGRGDYNDVVIADPSVSTIHAKLQRREAIWVLTDLGSTNGTFVEGERLTGETPLSPGTTLQFGDVAALFEPLDDHIPAVRTKQTRIMGRLAPKAPEPDPVPELQRARPRPRRPARMPQRPANLSPLMIVGLLVLMVILAYLLLS
jgi:pSer/pThr/pTyr-binding forkhead associated (FHA) protein